MKVSVYYDVICDFCGRSMSYDFKTGLCDSEENAVKEAYRIGFSEFAKKPICPVCRKKMNQFKFSTENTF